VTRYLIRLDDAHERHHPARWTAVEALLDKYEIRPIVAVIPDNRDESIVHVSQPDPDFWRKVKTWQAKGWTIGIHGLHHDLRDVAGASLLPMSRLAEFTGLSEDVQGAMIERALEIFEAHEIAPDVFVAPAHGFDRRTLAALRRSRRPLILSDGFGFRPVVRRGLAVLPQQLWRGRALPFGTWTICLHPSNMGEQDLQALESFLCRHQDACTAGADTLRFAAYGARDFLVEQLLRTLFLARQLFRRRRQAHVGAYNWEGRA